MVLGYHLKKSRRPMAYSLQILPEAKKDLAKIDHLDAQRIAAKMKWFLAQENPLHFSKPLHDSSSGDIRFRVGEYRIIASVDTKARVIVIAAIGNRKNVYTKK